MKAISPTTSEKLHSQSEAGRVNKWKAKLKNYIPPYYHMPGIKTDYKTDKSKHKIILTCNISTLLSSCFVYLIFG